MKTLTFRGRLLSYGYQEVEGRLFIIQKELLFTWE